MVTLTLNINDELAAPLREQAERQGLSAEEWVKQLIEKHLTIDGFDSEFETILTAVVKENAELYRRLA